MNIEAEQRVAAAKASGGTSAGPIYRAVLGAIRELRLGGHILDFGAGTGSLCRDLCEWENFTAVTGADLVAFELGARHPKLNWIFGDLNQPLPAGEGAFDSVVAVEVIEHLENPRFVVRELYRVLKPGGTLILTTPNNESWRAIIALILKGHFEAFDDPCYPAHITALVRKDFSRIFSEAGFVDIGFRYTDDGPLPKFTRVTWQQLSCGLLRGRRYSGNLLCVARKP